MEWAELSVEADLETADPVVEVFRRLGGGGVVVEQLIPSLADGKVCVKTYLPADASLASRRSRVDLGIRLLRLIRPLGPLMERQVSEEDWASAWREHFHVLHVGERIVICPTWRSYSARPGEVVVRLDPGMAFGTGLHPTTRMCLELLERLVWAGMQVLDLGTGSGILAIAAAKLGVDRILALDTDPVAVRVAADNVSLNAVDRQVTVAEGTLSVDDRTPKFCHDLVVANITAKTVSDLAPAMVGQLKPGGLIIAGGILDQQVGEVEKTFVGLGFRVREVVGVEDWRTLVIEQAQS
ncbi:MAG: 50S ribosomal protein L11 methyltransferase [Dehalococcoidia bacterium]